MERTMDYVFVETTVGSDNYLHVVKLLKMKQYLVGITEFHFPESAQSIISLAATYLSEETPPILKCVLLLSVNC